MIFQFTPRNLYLIYKLGKYFGSTVNIEFDDKILANCIIIFLSDICSKKTFKKFCNKNKYKEIVTG